MHPTEALSAKVGDDPPERWLVPGVLFVTRGVLEEDAVYAIVETGGKQYKVAEGDTVQVEREVLASLDGDVSRELIEWERAFARGGAGIVTVGVANKFGINITLKDWVRVGLPTALISLTICTLIIVTFLGFYC